MKEQTTAQKILSFMAFCSSIIALVLVTRTSSTAGAISGMGFLLVAAIFMASSLLSSHYDERRRKAIEEQARSMMRVKIGGKSPEIVSVERL